MSRYIDVDKIISYLNDEIEACGDPDVDFQPVVYGTYLGLKCTKSFVETAETADEQEIVRCKDCAVPHNRLDAQNLMDLLHLLIFIAVMEKGEGC